jgi:hypothetical protein
MRIGFDNPVLPVIKPVLLALFIFTFPALVSGSLLAKNYRNEARPRSMVVLASISVARCNRPLGWIWTARRGDWAQRISPDCRDWRHRLRDSLH